MRTMRPTDRKPAPARLAFDALGAGSDGGERVRISIEPPRDAETLDLTTRPALAGVAEQPGVVAIQAFRLPSRARPIGFTLSIALVLVPGPPPGLDTFPDAEVKEIELQVGSGVRIRRRRPGPPLSGGVRLPVLVVDYLLATPHGALSLTFSTPHLDGDEEWTALFDQLAASATCTSSNEPATTR